MKKVTIEPGCITCGLCEFVAPDVFEVTDVSRVKEDADIEKNLEAIEEAVRSCPGAGDRLFRTKKEVGLWRWQGCMIRFRKSGSILIESSMSSLRMASCFIQDGCSFVQHNNFLIDCDCFWFRIDYLS